MLDFISKLFGSKKDKDVRELQPLVRKINEYYDTYQKLSDDELRGKTLEFKNRINEYLKDIRKTF
jgi:preprotein translocase subunit SecA